MMDSIASPGAIPATTVIDAATGQGVLIRRAEDDRSYSDFQMVPSGDTTHLAWADFDADGDGDQVIVNRSGRSCSSGTTGCWNSRK